MLCLQRNGPQLQCLQADDDEEGPPLLDRMLAHLLWRHLPPRRHLHHATALHPARRVPRRSLLRM